MDTIAPLEPSPPFVRALDPSDRWLTPKSYTDEDRQENFRGNPDWDISVAMESRCPPARVLAALHGARRDVVLDRPAYYRFSQAEVEEVGGDLEDTPSKPPWPKDYCHAHHDIVEAHDRVAEHMANLYLADPARVVEEEEEAVLMLIAQLLAHDDVDKKFRKGARYRFGRMFEDEPDLWKRIAREHHVLLEHANVKSAFRKMYQDKITRPRWRALMDELGVADADRTRFR